jgi:hypothetical protein
MIIVIIVLVASVAMAQDERGPINLLDFEDHALEIGTEQEDWQPAFQEALKLTQDGQRPIYVPAGEYKIRQAITILPMQRPNGGWYHGPRIYGDGMYQSVISQQVDSENCIDWTGETYENSAKNGQLDHIWLNGGTMTLNLKWHNSFKLDACRISGALEYGIYTEGWSSRFLNSVIRGCGEAGFYGYAHYNNAIIRDCYFSRCKVGALIHGGHGSRISGCGFEQCAQDGVLLRNVKGFTVSDTYFEGVGYLDGNLEAESPANAIEIDFNCWGVSIHDCIFRAQKDPNGALIAISDIKGGQIHNNLFWTNSPVQNGILLLEKPRQRPDWNNKIVDLVVEGNTARNIRSLLTEQTEGLVENARLNGSCFQWEIGEEAPQ